MRGASAVDSLLRRDTTALALLVVWEHVTPSDHGLVLPGTSVLARVRDPRAMQFWDDTRALSARMVADLPADTLASVAQIESSDVKIVWDCVALFRPGMIWQERFPVPDWSGRPVIDVLDTFRRRLAAMESANAPPRRGR